MVYILKIAEFLLFKCSTTTAPCLSQWKLVLRCCCSEDLEGVHRKYSPVIPLFCQARNSLPHPGQTEVKLVYSPNQSCIHFHSRVWRTVSPSTSCFTYKVWGWTWVYLAEVGIAVCLRRFLFYVGLCFSHHADCLVANRWSKLQSIHGQKSSVVLCLVRGIFWQKCLIFNLLPYWGFVQVEKNKSQKQNSHKQAYALSLCL